MLPQKRKAPDSEMDAATGEQSHKRCRRSGAPGSAGEEDEDEDEETRRRKSLYLPAVSMETCVICQYPAVAPRVYNCHSPTPHVVCATCALEHIESTTGMLCLIPEPATAITPVSASRLAAGRLAVLRTLTEEEADDLEGRLLDGQYAVVDAETAARYAVRCPLCAVPCVSDPFGRDLRPLIDERLHPYVYSAAAAAAGLRCPRCPEDAPALPAGQFDLHMSRCTHLRLPCPCCFLEGAFCASGDPHLGRQHLNVCSAVWRVCPHCLERHPAASTHHRRHCPRLPRRCPACRVTCTGADGLRVHWERECADGFLVGILRQVRARLRFTRRDETAALGQLRARLSLPSSLPSPSPTMAVHPRPAAPPHIFPGERAGPSQ